MEFCGNGGVGPRSMLLTQSLANGLKGKFEALLGIQTALKRQKHGTRSFVEWGGVGGGRGVGGMDGGKRVRGG